MSALNAVFKAIKDPNRREILELLKHKDLNAGEIAEHFHMSRPSISHHLDILRQADLVSSRKEGQFIIYSINTTVVDELFQWVFNFKQSLDENQLTKRTSSLGSTDITGDLPRS
jgi:DNA-binding transcriptional ArsR family regulator